MVCIYLASSRGNFFRTHNDFNNLRIRLFSASPWQLLKSLLWDLILILSGLLALVRKKNKTDSSVAYFRSLNNITIIDQYIGWGLLAIVILPVPFTALFISVRYYRQGVCRVQFICGCGAAIFY